MESTAGNAEPGFTLIELLVVISIVAVLIAILLPALAQGKAATRGTICAGKLGQMMVAWEVTLFHTQDRIPDVFIQFPPVPQQHERWWVEMEKAARTGSRDINNLSPERASLVCPEIRLQFGDAVHANAYYGYAINTRWRPDWESTDPLASLGNNENQIWSEIRYPSSYPWFVDPFVTSTPAARSYFAAVESRDWDIGFYHLGASSRVAYADGHVATITREVFAGEKDSAGVPLWFFDTP